MRQDLDEHERPVSRLGAVGSLYELTAPPAPAIPDLTEDLDLDVAVVGAGYTGLSTALHLASSGARICVLDAVALGWGGSGRNGGQVIPGLKYDPDDLVALLRRTPYAEKAERLVEVIGTAADNVFDLVKVHGIECEASRAGWIQPAYTPKMMKSVAARASQWSRRGAPVELLDAGQVTKRLGSAAFIGGWVDRRAGSVQPLGFTFGLARAALARGVSIYGNARVVSMNRIEGRWHLRTATGQRVRAERVVIGTNGYTDQLWPRLRETVIAANSMILATEPLPALLTPEILPGGEAASDARRLLLYFRRDAAGRFLIGGRGPFNDPQTPADYEHLDRAARILYPQLGDIPFVYRWAGRVAITRDFLPHVHEPAPGVTIAIGYNGRGVAMATTMGIHLSRRLSGAPDSEFPFPVSDIRRIPLHWMQRLYIEAGVLAYGVLDRFS